MLSSFFSFKGDSGGAAVQYDSRGAIQKAVVSFGKYCGTRRFPAIFVHLPSMVEWIQEMMTSN